MIFIYQKNTIYYKMIQIGAVGSEIWRIGSEKWGSRRGQLDMCALVCNFKAQVLWVGCPEPYIYIYIYIYSLYTVFLAGKSPNIRSYTVYLYGSAQS